MLPSKPVIRISSPSIKHMHISFSYKPVLFLSQKNWKITFEPLHDKTQQSGMCAQQRIRSAWASAQSDQSLCCPHKARVLSYPLSAQQRHWPDCADAHADLSLRWAHSHFVGFVMRRLIWLYYYVIILLLLNSLFKITSITLIIL